MAVIISPCSYAVPSARGKKGRIDRTTRADLVQSARVVLDWFPANKGEPFRLAGEWSGRQQKCLNHIKATLIDCPSGMEPKDHAIQFWFRVPLQGERNLAWLQAVLSRDGFKNGVIYWGMGSIAYVGTGSGEKNKKGQTLTRKRYAELEGQCTTLVEKLLWCLHGDTTLPLLPGRIEQGEVLDLLGDMEIIAQKQFGCSLAACKWEEVFDLLLAQRIMNDATEYWGEVQSRFFELTSFVRGLKDAKYALPAKRGKTSPSSEVPRESTLATLAHMQEYVPEDVSPALYSPEELRGKAILQSLILADLAREGRAGDMLQELGEERYGSYWLGQLMS